MRFSFLYLIVLALIFNACAASNTVTTSAGDNKLAINNVLNNQQQAWNRGDLEGYMQGYWQSDSLTFIGIKGLTYGWTQTLNNYRNSYPDKATMGQLQFTVLKLETTSNDTAYMVGKWHLSRQVGNLDGYFSLLWRKIGGRWLIVSDHSS